FEAAFASPITMPPQTLPSSDESYASYDAYSTGRNIREHLTRMHAQERGDDGLLVAGHGPGLRDPGLCIRYCCARGTRERGVVETCGCKFAAQVDRPAVRRAIGFDLE